MLTTERKAELDAMTSSQITAEWNRLDVLNEGNSLCDEERSSGRPDGAENEDHAREIYEEMYDLHMTIREEQAYITARLNELAKG